MGWASYLHLGERVGKHSRLTAKDFYHGSASNHSFLSIEPFNYANKNTQNGILRKFDAEITTASLTSLVLPLSGPYSPCLSRYEFDIALKLNSPSSRLNTMPSLFRPLTPLPSARATRSVIADPT